MPKNENIDAFWDIEDMLPKRTKKQVPHPVSADISATEISLTPSADTEQTASFRIPPRQERKENTAVPTIREYENPNGMIRHVCIRPWPTVFGFYEKFRKDALTYFNRTHEPCEYVYFFSYLPQYEQMTVSQMAYYVYWRSEIRKGIYIKSDLNYILLYAYEIINLPEKISPKQGAIILSRLWSAYRDDFRYLDKYIGEWLCDYCLLYDVSPDWDVLEHFIHDIAGKLSFPEFYLKDNCLPFGLISVISAYDYKKSKYYDQCQAAYDKHIPAAMERAAEQIIMKCPEAFGIIPLKLSRDSFSGAIACHAMKFKIEILRYTLRRTGEIKTLFANMIKLCENQIRAVYGIKSRFSPNGIDERLKDVILSYFDEQYPDRNIKKTKKEAAEEEAYMALYEPKQNGPADISRALAIEEEAWETAALLATEEEEEPVTETLTPPMPKPEKSPPPEENPFSFTFSEDSASGDFDFINDTLSEEQRKALAAALNGTFSTYCRSIGKMEETVRGEINEIAMEYIGDMLIESDFTIIEDYMEDIKHEIES
ncbi:MAG: TerB N-terminal domain-containing protein [Clostridia bacterium]|nr:TerB N-terminal domain-containing protein [Clostridia bacterium]